MYTIYATNVNDAYEQGLKLLRIVGEFQNSRAGKVLVAPGPVTTVYKRPQQRVLFDARRDANPFFHLFESLWMLSGNNDARWLDTFVKDFSSRFSESDGFQHGAYGFRWREHFDLEGGGAPNLPNQLDTVVRLLKQNPDDRRVVLTMWDPVSDLGADKKDIPCNTHAYLRVRNEEVYKAPSYGDDHEALEFRPVLDLTVCCRSNDAIWGAYGANAVHFSVLQEYLAACIGVGVGIYYQISNNFHVYLDVLDKVAPIGYEIEGDLYALNRGASIQPMVSVPEKFDVDLARFMWWTTDRDSKDGTPWEYTNHWFSHTAEPLFMACLRWRAGERENALAIVNDGIFDTYTAPDWRLAARLWMERRLKKEN